MADLVNKVIVVTGAGQGIGRALCQHLSALGAKVIALSKSADKLEELKNSCSAIKTISIDLTNWQSARETLSQLPQIDGLVNNAGVAIIKPFDELTEQDFDETFDINIKAVFNVTQTLLPKLNKGSSIVMVSSLAASRSFAGHTIYSASKAAVDSLTRSLALELGAKQIRVNSVNPTVVLTKMGRDNWSDPDKSGPLLAHIPLHRFCEVQEVVDGITYLLSGKSSFVNGHHLNLEGGYSVS
ncbi:PREDICTED: L-xylulose reductase [Rhagoletis zephyria]|uniref:L-xylulose reductase n=1 Tax=Rhagoletis zephyria TaxID=28612 RepID=UPI000811682E|nr:PREDICTED: L-xylulose reductase [Rhagoletis zephyria]XP_036348084.1 L-xylulose reductase [Rhagoletis pomonella]